MATTLTFPSHLDHLHRSVEEFGRDVRYVRRFITHLIRLPELRQFRSAQLGIDNPGQLYTDLSMHLKNAFESFSNFINFTNPAQICADPLARLEAIVDEVKLRIHLLSLGMQKPHFENLVSGLSSAQGAYSFELEPLVVSPAWSLIFVVVVLTIGSLIYIGYYYITVNGPQPQSCLIDQLNQLHTFESSKTQDREAHPQLDQTMMERKPLFTQPAFMPPHLILLRYIYPTSSNWPPAYLQAFARAQASQLSSSPPSSYITSATFNSKIMTVGRQGIQTQTQMQTHIDTPPAANTRGQRDQTAKRSNGKIFLSRKAVRRDLEDGEIGLRAGIKLSEGRREVVSPLIPIDRESGAELTGSRWNGRGSSGLTERR